MSTGMQLCSAARAGVCLLLAHALLACSLIVDGELEGKRFGSREDGGGGGVGGGSMDAGGDGATPSDDGGGVDGASGGSGSGGGTDAGTDAGGDAGADDGGMDAGPPGSLSVVATTPDDDESSTYRYTEVKVVFSADLSSLEDSQLKVTHRETDDDVAGSVETDGDTATFTSDSPILLSGHYDVTVDRDVATPDGIELGDDYNFTFSLVAGFPEDTEYLDRTDTPGSSEPDVGVDAEGNAIVIWLQRGAGGSGVYSAPWVAHYTHGDGWATPRALDMPNGRAYSPKIAVATDGTAFAAWTHDPNSGSTPSTVMASRYTPGGGWSSPTVIDSDPDSLPLSQHVAVAVGANDDAVVAWSRGASTSSNGEGNFFVSLYTAGDFSAPVAILEDATAVPGSGPIEAALTSDGLAIVAGTLGGGHAVYAQQAGETDWIVLYDVYDSDDVPGEGAALAIDADGVVHMGADYEWGSIEVARLTSPLKKRNASRFTEMRDPHVAMAASKDVIGAWQVRGTTSTTSSIWAITYDHVEDEWAMSATDVFPERTLTDVPSPPDVAAYLDTGALITWASDGELYGVDRSGGSYGDATKLARVEHLAEAWVRVAANPIGTGVLVWTESDGVNASRVAAQSFRGSP